MATAEKVSPKSGSGVGGARPGAGRPKGGHNRRTVETMAKAAQGQSPLDFLLGMMRDDGADEKMRLAAATAAAPYVHAKLSAVELTGPDGGPMQLQTVRRVIVDPKHGDK